MSTALSSLAKLVTVAIMLFAIAVTPNLAYAGGGPKSDAPKVVVSPQAKAGRFSNLSRAARAHLARARMAGMSVAGNAAWAAGLLATSVYSFVTHDPVTAVVTGGVATYNGVQAIRKARAEKAMLE
jgi:hypothetical protein